MQLTNMQGCWGLYQLISILNCKEYTLCWYYLCALVCSRLDQVINNPNECRKYETAGYMKDISVSNILACKRKLTYPDSSRTLKGKCR